MIKENPGNLYRWKSGNRYVIFFCDECDLLEPVITIFRNLYPADDVVTFSDMTALLAQTKQQRPELVLVYLANPENDYITLVKRLRENAENEMIPIFIYRTLPDEGELKRVFASRKKE